ncbi:NADH-quinone oxidoreductase subunit L, partial [bacterium]|nr:NADH-quinone oxidoreductase subunit L [bacterium]
NNDIKKVLAYSTISQLGYMFLACGVGAFSAGIFHLSTHAYFKALLFLSAGSVMHALSNETDMRNMGGLRHELPVTFRVFLIGALALAGVPLLSGFFSKDEILWKTVASTAGGYTLWLAGALVAGMTAFYTFRLIFLTFFGESRVPSKIAKQIHESPRVMTVPLMVLSVLAIVGGFVGIPHLFQAFEHFLDPVFARYVNITLLAQAHGAVALELVFMAISIVIAFLGIGVAYFFYLSRPELPEAWAMKFKPVYDFLANKWFVDELYHAVIVRPISRASDLVLWRWLDIKIIDGLINKTGVWFREFSEKLRRVETGIVQNYALSIVVGIVALIGYFLVR